MQSFIEACLLNDFVAADSIFAKINDDSYFRYCSKVNDLLITVKYYTTIERMNYILTFKYFNDDDRLFTLSVITQFVFSMNNPVLVNYLISNFSHFVLDDALLGATNGNHMELVKEYAMKLSNNLNNGPLSESYNRCLECSRRGILAFSRCMVICIKKDMMIYLNI
jgi:hypothetical protein